MSDTSDRRGGFGGASGEASTSSGSVTEQATTLVRDLKDQTSSALGQATSQIKDQVSGATDAAKGLVSEAGDKLRSAVEEQKTAGADFVGGMAGAIRRAAGEFEQIPQAGHYIRRAAEQVEAVADALRRRDVGELVGGMQDFARRQPTAFLGAAVLAGFAAVRFLKSSTGARSDPGNGGMADYRGAGAYGGGSAGGGFGNADAGSAAGRSGQSTGGARSDYGSGIGAVSGSSPQGVGGARPYSPASPSIAPSQGPGSAPSAAPGFEPRR
jgi:hypothetical protein